MKMLKKCVCAILSIALIILSLGTLTSCGKAQKFTAYAFNIFDTVATVTTYSTSRTELDKVSRRVFDRLEHYHVLFDIYNKYDGVNNLSTVNSIVDGEHPTVTVHRDIIDLLLYAKQAYQLTGGALNVAMGSVLSIWHDYRTTGMKDPVNATLPPMTALLAAAEHVNLDAVVIDEVNSTVTITDPKVRLDVGAIAKGWAVERVAEELEREGIEGYVLNVGGNVRTLGTKPGGDSWIAGVENPFGDPDLPFLKYVELNGMAIVTSGSYQRFYVVGDKSYHHIIDGKTLMPSDRYTSVSIICGDSGLGDALSTALFCLSIEDGKAIIAGLADVEVMWVTPDGEITTTDGFAAYEYQMK